MELQNHRLMVSAGCLLFFGNHRSDTDVIDAALYTQLFASKKHSRLTDHERWKKAWLEAAIYLGWDYQGSLNFVEPAPCQESATFWDWAKALRPAFVSEALVEGGEKALQQCSLQQAAFTVFANQVLDPGATAQAMQVGLLDRDKSLTLLQLHFECRSPLSRDSLFGPWSPAQVKGNIRFSFHRLLLSSEALYRERREALFRKLDDRRAGLVLPVLSQGSKA